MALCFEGVDYATEAASGRQTLLRDISLNLATGRIHALFGPSGGGKSTLLRLITRLSRPQRGRILWGGEDIAGIDPQTLRRRIALVPQQPHMFEGSVLANLQLPFRWRRQPLPTADSSPMRQVLTRCRLDQEWLERSARQLSVGQQQRVALARTLLLEPELLLLDEPTSALDRPTADLLGETLRELCRDGRLTLLLVTHDLRLLERVADLGVFLAAGEVIEQGELPGLLQAPQSRQLQAFLADPREGVA